MKNPLKDYMEIPAVGTKITEKVLFTRIGMSVLLIVFFLAAMSFTAYAYFSADIHTGKITITAAKYDLDVTVDGNAVDSQIQLSAGTYDVVIQNVESQWQASTGFCVIQLGDTTLVTQQIGADKDAEGGERREVRFTLVITGEGSVNVSFEPRWGTSAYYVAPITDEVQSLFICNGETVTYQIPAAPREEDAPNQEESAPTEPAPRPTEHVVQEGEYLTLIANRYGTTASILAAYNDITNPDHIEVGAVIKIPPEGWFLPDPT